MATAQSLLVLTPSSPNPTASGDRPARWSLPALPIVTWLLLENQPYPEVWEAQGHRGKVGGQALVPSIPKR